MSYRIWASNCKDSERNTKEDRVSHQVYGNNEFPKEIHDYLESKGCKFNEDDCFYDFEITDIQEFLEAMLKAHNSYMRDDSYWDFKPTRPIETPEDLISHCGYKIALSYAYIVYNFWDSFKKEFRLVWDNETKREFYQINEGKHIYLSGF